MDRSDGTPAPLPAGWSVPPLLVALPALAAALLLCALEGYRAVRPDAPLFGAPPGATFAEALTSGRVEEAHAFLVAGAKADQPLEVVDPRSGDGHQVVLSPLAVAVARQDSNMVRMLLGAGVRMDLPQNRSAVCMAQTLGDREIAATLLGAATPAVECAPPSASP